MNLRTKYKIMDFLKSRGVDEVHDVESVDIDFQTETLDIDYVRYEGDRYQAYELSSGEEITKFIEYLVTSGN